jgi:hypothetical protein
MVMHSLLLLLLLMGEDEVAACSLPVGLSGNQASNPAATLQQQQQLCS